VFTKGFSDIKSLVIYFGRLPTSTISRDAAPSNNQEFGAAIFLACHHPLGSFCS